MPADLIIILNNPLPYREQGRYDLGENSHPGGTEDQSSYRSDA